MIQRINDWIDHLIKKFYRTSLGRLIDRMSRDHVSAYSAQAAFFVILSTLPFLLVLISIIKHTPLSEAAFTEFLYRQTPDSAHAIIKGALNQVYNSYDMTLISLTVIIACWSSSKGVLSVIQGINTIHRKTEERSYVMLRIIALLYTVLFTAAIVLVLGLVMFGHHINMFLKTHTPMVAELFSVLFSNNILITFLLLLLFFLCINKIVPDKKYTILNCLPGACFSAASWLIFSALFSIYVDTFSNYNAIYGSFTAIIVILLWLYFCMYLLYIGIEINVVFHLQINAFLEAPFRIFRKTRKKH